MKLLLSVACMLFPLICPAQFYAGAEVSGGINQTVNSGLQFGSGGIGRGYNDRVVHGLMYAGHISFSYERRHFWVESGFGLYNLTESHKISSAIIGGRYRNIRLPLHYWYVPVKIGLKLKQVGKLTISPYAGVNYLVEITTFGGPGYAGYTQQVPLKARSSSAYTGSYSLYQNDLSYAALLFCAGLRVARKVSARSVVLLSGEVNVGFKVLQSMSVLATEDRGPGVTVSNFGSTKGDGFGISVGYRHRLSR